MRSSPIGESRSLRASLERLRSEPARAKRGPRATKAASGSAASGSAPFVRKPVLQELEARLLLSADLNPAAQDALLATPALQGAEFRALAEATVPTVVTTAQVAPIQRTNEIVFVDTQTPDYLKLVAQMREAGVGEGRNIEFVLIDASKDGIRKITDTLAQRSDLDAIHILSHGDAGSLQLGAATLDFDSLVKRSSAIKKWGDALTERGDILIYGCDLAATQEGKSLVDALARLTRADVAASDDLTGAAKKGGDWELEFKRGEVEAGVAVSLPAQGEWDHLLATYTVTSTADAGAGTLREAITLANANAGADIIDFNIAGAGPHTINIAAALPNINEAVTIDATSEPDFAGTPVVVLDGNGVAANGLTLTSTADGSTIRGLVIRDFGADGIRIEAGSDNNLVAGNYIGRLTAAGTDAGAGEENDASGIRIFGANNIIGGTTAADRNVISGNAHEGVVIEGGVTASGNVVRGNYIGTDAAGTAAIGNGWEGVQLWFVGANNVIGGTASGAGNVISGNGRAGVRVDGASSTGTLIQGNYIGTDKDGAAAIANGVSIPSGGIELDSGVIGATIGGGAPGARNVISGNVGNGISIGAATGNTIQGNLIGTNAAGTARLANTLRGIALDAGADGNTIGGAVAAEGNVVSGNALEGIFIFGGDGNVVQNNLVGVDASGAAALGNTLTGIVMRTNGADGAQNNTIGGAGRGNVVGANRNGVSLEGVGTTGNVVQGNSIGTDATGTVNLGNAEEGVEVYNGAASNTIGLTILGAGAGNTIANNGGAAWDGVWIGPTSTGNSILGNAIYASGDLDIDLDSGVTPNDVNDVDLGANDLQNTPVLYAASINGANLTVYGGLNSIDATTYRIEFFATSAGGVSRYLGTTNVTTVGNNATINYTIVGAGVVAGETITATATSAATNDTSEFSSSVVANNLTVSGTVRHDVNANANVADDGGAVFENATVRLYVDDGDGAIDAGDLFVGSATTDGSGQYGFANLGEATYWVTVDSRTLTLLPGQFNGGAPDQDNVWAEQTYGDDWTTGAIDLGARYGGRSAATSDDAVALATSDHVARAVLAGANLAGVDSGFSFSAIVNTRGDVTDDHVGADRMQQGSLRQFILNSNAIAGVQTTVFRLSASDPNHVYYRDNGGAGFGAPVATAAATDGAIGDFDADYLPGTARSWWRIRPVDADGAGMGFALPGVRDRVVFDGTTQPGFNPLTDAPIVELDGELVPLHPEGYGLQFQNGSDGSTVRGLVMNDWGSDALNFAPGADGNFIWGNYIGTDVSGLVAEANLDDGIDFDSAANTVGGLLDWQRNLISGNRYEGITINSASANNNVVLGNYIGVNAAGTAALPNGTSGASGIWIRLGAHDNIIGGTAPEARNVISGNTQYGVRIEGTAGTGNVVLGNYIGTNAAGTAALGNLADGVLILGNSNTIGGGVAGAGNVISGNRDSGIQLAGGATGNRVLGNYIGTNFDGTAAISNNADGGSDGDGIRLSGANGNTIGGTTALERNVISGNDAGGDPTTHWEHGVYLWNSDNNLIQGNYIGTNAAGAVALRNFADGIGIDGDAVGGFSSGNVIRNNLVSGNKEYGVWASDDSPNQVIQGNLIGTNFDGTAAIANGVGGVSAPNPGAGIRLDSSGNLVGGTLAAERNVISGNVGAGIALIGTNATGNRVQGNFIGTTADGLSGLGNAGSGVEVAFGASGNTIGGAASGAGNVIGANAGDGIALSANADNIVIYGNWIGTNAGGSNLGNTGRGIYLLGGGLPSSSPTNIDIGGTGAGEANTIAFNAGDGIEVIGNPIDDVRIIGNSIHTNGGIGIDLLAGGDLMTGVTQNDYLPTPDSNTNGPNRLQNFPEWTATPVLYGNTLRVSGTLWSTTSTYFTVHFYANTAADPSGYGEGQRYLGSTNVLTNNVNGQAIFNNVNLAVPPGSVSAGDRITMTATRTTVAWGAPVRTSEFSFASNPVIVARTISGTVANDDEGDGSVAGDGGFQGVTVRLYRDDDGDFTADNGDTLLQTVVTAADGSYSFAPVLPGSTYWVVVDSKTIGQAGVAYNSGNYTGVWAEQTYGDNSSSAGLDVGTRYGGRNLIVSDDAWDAVDLLVAPEHVGRIDLGAADQAGVDFGFSFVAITNTRGDTTDDDEPATPGTARLQQGTLRQFIENSNRLAGIQTANFSLALNDSNHRYYSNNGVAGTLTTETVTALDDASIANFDPDYPAGTQRSWWRINMDAALPQITDTVVLDGTSQEGYDPAKGPIVELRRIAGFMNGLVLAGGSSGSTVAGLVVNTFQYNGILVQSNNNVISGNYVGTDVSGTRAVANATQAPGPYAGIHVTGTGNLIGGDTQAERNVISGNGGVTSSDGIRLAGSGNTVQGNYIGTNVTGTAALANRSDGIEVTGANNVIGGDRTLGEGNLISGNGNGGAGHGINVNGAGATGTRILGNFIGSDATGTLDLGNAASGVNVQASASGTTIGGTVSGERNVISGNVQYGIRIDTSSNNVVQGNYIGTTAAGNVALANDGDGIRIQYASSGNTIGGAAPGAGNVIGGNLQSGIRISSSDVTGGDDSPTNNVVQGNWIGTNSAGDNLGNTQFGVYVLGPPAAFDSPDNNVIGTTSAGASPIPEAGAGNVIAFNTLDGVRVEGGVDRTRIAGNSIHDNVRLGINLVGATEDGFGTTSNDVTGTWDSDAGANRLQNWPVLSGAYTDTATSLTVQGQLQTLNGTYRVHFYMSAAADVSGHGEGTVYLGYTDVIVNGGPGYGTGVINHTFSPIAMPTGRQITATATDPNGNTSEFSLAVATTTLQTISGTIYDDDEGDGAIGGDGGFVGATVRLYRDDGDNTPDSGDTLIATAATGAGGAYSFANVSSGSTYWVVVDSKTLDAASIAGTVWADQTYGDDWTTDPVDVATRYGGRNAAISDNAWNGAGALQAPEHVSRIVLGSADVAGVDSAFSFVSVTNDRGDATDDDQPVNAGTARLQQGSLRQAILNANAIAGTQTVDFSVGTGSVTINVSGAALPQIDGALILDTATQAGYAGTPIVLLDGNGIAGNGLTLGANADGSQIRGFVIRNFADYGIEILAGSDSNLIAGNYVGGLTFAGADAGLAERNLSHGVRISGSNNVVGGTNAADRNVIARNARDGVFVNSGDGNVIIGNYIGTDAAGNAALSNEDGIQVNKNEPSNPTNTRIGGTAAGEGNLISGNVNHGIEVYKTGSGGNGSGVVIQGNRIGTNAAGNAALGNGGEGVWINFWDAVTVGGTAAGAGNTIAYNGDDGIGANIELVTVLGNAIFQNGNASNPGIDFGSDFATPNDPGNPDALPQNYPVIAAIRLVGLNVEVDFALDSDVSQAYRIEFFSNPPADPNEGRVFLGAVSITTNASGLYSGTAVLTPALLPALGDRVTATATRDLGGGNYSYTSEFSASALVAIPPVNTVPGAQTVDEDTVLAFNGPNTISVADSDGNLATTRLTVTNGVLNVTLAGGATIGAGANGSATMTISGTQAAINATLASLTYQGALNFNGADTLTVVSTDAASGADTDTVAINVSAVNDAPVLNAAASPALAAVAEDAAAPAGAVGTLVSALVDFTGGGGLNNVTDVDAGAVTGIAITATDSANGAWWYSTDGGASWLAAGAVADNNALLLAADGSTRVYFQPNADYSGTVANGITFRAWDRSAGAAGTKVDTSTNGGTTAFSTATDTASIAVTAINDAPVLADTALTLTPVAEDAGAPAGVVGDLVATLVGGITDVDGPATGIAITGVSYTGAGSGTWYYSTNNGGTWNAFVPGVANSRLLAADANTRIYFRPAANWNGTATLTVRAWDASAGANGGTGDTTTNGGATAFSGATDTVVLAVTAANDAPVAAGAASLAAVAEDTANPPGATVSALFGANFSDATDNVAGGSSAHAFAGIAITANAATAGQGTWQWFDGAAWQNVSTSVSTASALVLADTTFVRFLPAADYAGTPGSLTAKLVDASAGAVAPGATANVTVSGGTTQYSAGNVVLSTSITAVNDAPAIGNLAGDALAYSEGDGAVVIDQGAGATVTDVDSANFATGALTVSFTAGIDAAEDVLAIRNQGMGAGQVGVSGANVYFGGVQIGTYAGGSGGANLVITFNASATPAAVQALVRNITYTNTDNVAPTAGARTVQFVVTDGDGGTSAAVSATITVSQVNDAPSATIAPAVYSATEQVALNLAGTMSVADVDSGTLTVTLSVGSGIVTAGAGTTGVVVAGSGTGTVTLTGSVAALNDLLAGNLGATLTYTANSDNPPASTLLTLSADDGVAAPASDSATINIAGVNDAPSLNTSIPSWTEGDPPVVLHPGLVVTDPDDTQLTQATVDFVNVGGYVAGDQLSYNVALVPGGVTVSGNGRDTGLVFTGLATVAEYEALLRSVTFENTTDDPTGVQRRVRMFVHDANASGDAGGVRSGGTIIWFGAVNEVNDAPVNAVPGPQSVASGATLTFSSGNGNAISIADADAGATVQVTLTAANGTLTLSGTTGLAFGAGDGTADATMTFTGSIANINAALNGLAFTPATGYVGAGASLQIVTDDLGGTGAGGALTDSDTIAITVTGFDISGTVYHDVDGDADVALADGTLTFANATVRLYLDDGDGVIGAGDGLAATTTTNGSGQYSFLNRAAGTYWVVVDSTTLDSGALFNGAYDASWIWAEQTYGDDATTGPLVLGTRFGGLNANVSDAAGAANPLGSEHVAQVAIGGANVGGVDYGFSFNAIVTTDDGDDVAGNRTVQGSLRQFVLNANAIDNTSFGGTVAARTSNFSIAGAGVHTIQLVDPDGLGPLQGELTITDAVVLDARTQEGYAGTPLIEIDGTLAGSNAYGFRLDANGSEIRGLIINRFAQGGIRGTGDSNLIAGNWVGVDATGNADAGNGSDGVVLVAGADFNVIDGNVFAGNGDEGISLDGAANNVVTGNYVGVGADGVTVIGNDGDGIAIQFGATNNTIGGTAPAARNLVAGNAGPGVGGLANVRIKDAGTTGNVVLGNYIGVDPTGGFALPSPREGVRIELGASGNTIGGAAAGSGNVISGHAGHGILLDDADGNTVQRNLVGTNATGDAVTGTDAQPLGNRLEGIHIRNGSANNVIGGVGAGNVVAANAVIGGSTTWGGIWIRDAGSDNNVVQGNWFGTNAAGDALGLGYNGVEITDGASYNLIGGANAGEGNVIAYAQDDGIFVYDSGGHSTGNAFLRNSIYGNDVEANGDGIGIDLEDTPNVGVYNVTPNDGGDGDGGLGFPNEHQNYPVLTAATTGAGQVSVTWSLDSVAGATFRVEFFSSPAASPSGYGEGRTFLGAVTVVADGSGNVASRTDSFVALVPAGQVVSATATRVVAPGAGAAGTIYAETSEFSAAQGVVPADATPPTLAGFTSSTADGTYGLGAVINVTATMSEPVLAGAQITVTLDTGDTVVLVAAANGMTLTGAYIVGAGDNSADLNVTSVFIDGVQDLAGNAMVDNTIPGGQNLADIENLVIDTTAPAAPAVVSISTDTGVAGDEITTDQTLVFSGTSEANATVSVYLDAALIGTTVADGAGNWSFDYTATPLAAGSYNVTARATDAAGNVSALSAALPVTIDTTAPAAPAVVSISTDTGVAGDEITTDQTLVFSGTSEANATVSVYLDAALIGTTVADGAGNWSFDYTATPLAAGSYNVTARATDAAGNVSALSAALPVTIDTTAPAAPAVVSISTDTGVAGDEITTDQTLVFSGTSEANATVSVYLDAALIGTTVADGAGNWSFDYTATPLAAGSYNVTARATDAAGNVSALSAALPVTIDTTAPAAPAVVSISTDTGVAGDEITTDQTLVFSGTSEANATVSVYLDAALIGTTVADGAGNWSFDYTATPLAAGSYNVTARATDAAGNVSALSAALPVTIDTTAPAAPAVVSISTDTGVAGDEITTDQTLVFSGTSEANATVSVYLDAALIGTTVADGAGNWSFDYTATPLAAGSYNVTARATDAAGNVSALSAALPVTIDTTAPAAPAVVSISTDTGVAGDEITTDQTLVFSGTSEANATVSVYLDAALIGTTVADGAGNWSFDYTATPLAAGSYNVTARATDAAGNVSALSAALPVTIDTTAPAAPAVVSISTDTGVAGDEITTDQTLVFSGTSEANATVSVYLDAALIGTTVADGAGNWSFDYTATPLAAGSYNVTARATDAAGNVSALSAALPVTIDTTAPAAPAVVSISTDTGVAGDEITTDQTLVFSGTSEANATVSVYLDAALIGTTVADGAGNWSFDYTATPLAAGSYNVTARATDAAGNVSALSAALPVTIDTTAPAAPAVVSISTDTGVAGDEITTDQTLVFSGTSEANATVSVYLDAALIGTTVADGAGNWSFDYTATPLAAGSYNVTARATDAAGNVSALSAALPVTIDTTAPAAPAVVSISTDTGVAGDEITTDQTLVFSGTSEANATVSVYLDAALIGTTVADGAGNWSFDYTATPLAAGSYNVTARATDAAGNVSALSAALPVTIDTTAPAAPAVVSISTDTGVAGDEITTDQTLVFSGTSEANATVSVYLDAALIGTTVADGAGNWSFDYTATPLAAGSYNVTARATDAAGNVSALSAALPVTIDTTAPAAPAVVSISTDTGVAGDEITTDQTLVFSGTSEANATVSVYLDAALIGTTVADGAGNWSFDYTATPLAAGSYNVTARATDAAGNVSALSAALPVTIDTTAPAAPAVVSISTDTGVAGDEITTDQTLVFSGTSEANATVSVYLDAALIGTTVADGAGNWSFDYTATPLAAGSYNVTARATDAAGNVSALSAALPVTIDTTAPAAPAVVSISTDTGVAGDEITTDQTLVFSGTSEANATVSVYLDAALIGTTVADGAGNWSFDYTATPLAAGSYNVTARATDAAGNVSALSAALPVTIDTTAPAAPVVNNVISPTIAPVLTGSAVLAAGETLTVSVNGATYNVTPDGFGNWTLDLGVAVPASGVLGPFVDLGVYPVTATVTDLAGNATNGAGTVTIAINDAPVVTASGGALAYVENDPATAVDLGLTVSDIDNATLATATIRITAGYVAGEDSLSFVAIGGIAGAWDGVTGTLSLTGPATTADWQTVLRSVAYQNASENPNTGARTVTFVVNDGGLASAPATATVNVAAVNDAPTLTANTLTLGDGAAVTLGLGNLGAADVDNAWATLAYTVATVSNGQFELVAAPGVGVTTFTAAQIAAGQVRFVHDGSNLAPAYAVEVSDGSAIVGPFAATIVFNATATTPAVVPPVSGGGESTPMPVVDGGATTIAAVTSPGALPTAVTDVATGLATTFLRAPGAVSGETGDANFAEMSGPATAAASGGAVRAESAVLATAPNATPDGRFGPLRAEAGVIDTAVRLADATVASMRGSLEAGSPSSSLAEIDEEARQIEIVLGTIRVTGIALSVGAVWWAARAAGLVASLLTTTPAWRHVDPLPVLGRDPDVKDEEDPEPDQDKRADEHRARWVLDESPA